MMIGEVLKAWRCIGGMPLREAAERIGIPLPTLARIEAGGDMSADNLWKVMEFLFGEN